MGHLPGIGRYAEEHAKDGLTVQCAVPASDESGAKKIWEKQGLKGSCLLLDPAAVQAWEATVGTYYLVGADGKFAGPILTELPTNDQLKAADTPR